MSDIRAAVGDTIGRRIDRVFTRHFRDGLRELYLHFDDGTYIEIYGDFQCSGYIREHAIERMRQLFEQQAGEARFTEYPRRPPRAV